MNSEIIETLNQQIELANALERLYKNPDFKTVLLDYLFKNKSLELVKGLGVYSQSSQSYADVLVGLNAISYLQNVFDTIKDIGQSAKYDLEEYKLNPYDKEE